MFNGIKQQLHTMRTHRWQPCVFCQKPAWQKHCICSICQTQLHPIATPYCQLCAQSIPKCAPLHRCGQCLVHPPCFDRLMTVYQYCPLMQHLTHQMKFNNHIGVAVFLGHQLAEKLLEHGTWSSIIPVPIHPTRWRQRGYNQSDVMARIISKRLNIPIQKNCLIKIKNTAPLSATKQKRQPKKIGLAFSVQQPPKAHILLVDDLITTGSTAQALTQQLKQHGAETVTIATAVHVSQHPLFT